MDRFTARFRDPRVVQEHDAQVFQTPVIQLNVGSWEELKECFYIHQDVLPKQGFFEAAVKKQWKEGQQGVINLPEEDPKLFCIYVQWLYTKRLPVLDTDEYGNIRDGTDYSQLAHLSALGQRMLDTTFQNRVLDAFIAAMIEFNGIRSGLASIDIIYKATPQNSSGRKFMVAIWLYDASSTWLDEIFGAYNHEFLVDLSKALLDEPARQRRCDLATRFDGPTPREAFLEALSWPDYQFAKHEIVNDSNIKGVGESKVGRWRGTTENESEYETSW